ncbi:histidine kinase [Actinomycetota bacterium]
MSEKKSSEKKLKELIRLQKTILDNIPVLQYNVDPDGSIIDCNKLVLVTLGYKSKKELIGKSLTSTIYAPSSIEKSKKIFLKWKKTGIIKNEELQIKTKRGRIIDVLLNVNSLYDKDGKKKCSISTQIDITKRKKAEKEITSLSKFPEENPNPVFRVSKDLKIIYANTPAKKMLKKLGLKSKTIPKILANYILSSILQKKNNPMNFELAIDGALFEFNVIPVKGSDYFNIYGNNITGKRKTEKDNREVYKKRILIDERKYIARELHDTVTQTIFSANLIAEIIPRLWKKDPKGVLKRLEEIRQLNNTALTEMRSILYELRPSAFKGEDLKILLEELIRSLSIKSKIPLKLEIIKKQEYPHKVELGFYRIAQEALNNIIKHSEASKAKLILNSFPETLQMEISDNGIGFEEKNLTHENLGLVIMKERARIIGATIDIDSSINSGTKISVKYTRNK